MDGGNGIQKPALFISNDDGATWSEPLPLDHPQHAGAPLPVLDAADDGRASRAGDAPRTCPRSAARAASDLLAHEGA